MNRLAIALGCSLLLAAAAPAQPIVKDIVYGNAGGEALKLDMVVPEGDGPFPAIVCIHGGGWQQGHRRDMHPFMTALAKSGFVAASVEYRLTPKHVWPAQIEDCKCAVRFLRAKAGDYKIDPKRIGAMGGSAGGHLALMLAFTSGLAEFEGQGGHAGQSSSVQAVANYFGPTDLVRWKANGIGDAILKGASGKTGDGLLADLLGTADRKAPIVVKASPITYISKTSPPVVTFHGALDPIVPVTQAQLLHDALKTAGVANELMILPLGWHGWGGDDLERTKRRTNEFFKKHLTP